MMNYKEFLILAAAALLMGLSSKARPNDLYLTTTVRSYHADRHADYNEKNWGLGLRYKLDADHLSAVAGVYKNSLYKPSIYAGLAYTPIKWLTDVNVGFLVGGVTGYLEHAVPIFVPILMYQYKEVGINLIGIPPLGNIDSVVALQLEWRL